ncbi:MAG: Ig-like domain-containing protein, partial [Planctomycetota bacterium]|nr:Ig-like domain-containing protein [Planctomycetota bacterium]
RAAVDPQLTVSRIVVDPSRTTLAANGSDASIINIRSFGNSLGSPFDALFNFSVTTGSGSLSAAQSRVLRLAQADGAMMAQSIYRSGTTIGENVVIDVDLDGQSVSGTAMVKIADPTAPVALTISSDKLELAADNTDMAVISVSLAALSPTVTAADTTVRFSTDRGTLSSGQTQSSGGVAQVTLLSGGSRARETIKITARITDVDGQTQSASTTVAVQTRVLQVNPSTITLSTLSGAGASQQLMVTDSFTNTLVTGNFQTSYVSSSPSVATVTQAGLVTAVGPGRSTITITNTGNGTSVEKASVLVALSPNSINFVPSTISIAKPFDTVQLSLNGVVNGNNLDFTKGATGTNYVSSDPTILSVDVDGVVTAQKAGTASITASNGGQMATAVITVVPTSTASLTLTLSNTFLAAQNLNSITVSVSGLDLAGNPLPDGTLVNFSATGGSLAASQAAIINGFARVGFSSGTAVDGDVIDISANVLEFGGRVLSNTEQVTIRDRFLTVVPASATLTTFMNAGSTQQLMVLDGVTNADITNDPATTYTSNDTDVVTVSNGGLVTAVNNGMTTVSIVNAGVTVTFSVTVDVTPDSINATPKTNLLINVNDTQQLAVSGTFGSLMRDQTPAARGTVYTSSDPAIASVSADGLVTGLTPGMVTIQASNRGQTDTVSIDSLPNTTQMIAIQIDKTTVATNGVDFATITATLTPVSGAGAIPDGTVVNFQSTVGMLSASSATTVNGMASVTLSSGAAQNNQMTDITATTIGFNNTVTSNTLQATFRDRFITVDPASITLTAFVGVGSTQQLTIREGLTNVDITAASTFATSDATVAAVNSTGLVTAVNNGSAMITTTNNGVTVIAAVTVTVDPDSIASVPASAAFTVLGQTQQLAITGTFGAVMKDLTAMSTGTIYVSNDVNVVTVSPAGLLTATGNGATTVVVSNGTAMTTVSVTNDIASAFAVNPNALVLGNGDSQQLTATGNNTGMTDFTSVASFTSSDPNIASVSATGFVTGRNAGAATLTVTVPNLPNQTVAVTVNRDKTAVLLGQVTGTAGQTVTMPVLLDVNGTDTPSTISFEIVLPANITLNSNAVGAASTAAGKDFQVDVVNGNRLRVVVFDVNMNAISSGVLGTITLDIGSGVTAGEKAVTVEMLAVSDGLSNPINPNAGILGSVTVN